MFSSNKNKSRDRTSPEDDGTGEASRPLLEDHDVVFSIDDDDDEEPLTSSSKYPHSVRFQEDVQVIGLPLRSTAASREAEFELDSDEIDNEPEITSTPRAHMGSNVPLIVGLLDSSRQSLDSPLPLSDANVGDLDLEALAAKQTAGGGLFDSIANMANSILGAGIIGLPYAISQAGFFIGLLLLVVLCGVTDWTIRLIVVNAKLSGSHTYIDIMNHCFGSSGRAAVSFFQFSFAFGGMCAFGIIIGDTIPHVIRSLFPTLYKIPVLGLLTNRQFIIFLCTTCVSYPLSLYRDIHKLSRASGLALISMLVIVASVLVEGPQVPLILKGDPSVRFSFVNAGIFQAIGVISFAFVCHHNSLLIYGSLRTPTLDRFAQVTHVSTLISLVSCCTLAVSGYVVFTDKTQGNILNNFPSNNTLINLARFCFGLNMFTTLPLELFVCREVIEDYFFAHEGFNPQRHLFFTTTILFSSMSLAMITCDLGVMLEITGGVSATALAFIFPAACYLKLSNQSLPWHSRKRLPAFICVAFGVIVMTISLFLALEKSWTKKGEAKMCM
ncbi:amino acid transporter [Lentinula detonsa]|uniref:Amino acid transporter n=1 Tax=Lentinula detonsa TaxID=2804962 RepID=A0AA38Q7K6_9AGAR|nr:amino acid transporter [Lentinula detonsa]